MVDIRQSLMILKTKIMMNIVVILWKNIMKIRPEMKIVKMMKTPMKGKVMDLHFVIERNSGNFLDKLTVEILMYSKTLI